MKVTFNLDLDDENGEPMSEDYRARAACELLLDWLTEAGPSHVANFVEVSE